MISSTLPSLHPYETMRVFVCECDMRAWLWLWEAAVGCQSDDEGR